MLFLLTTLVFVYYYHCHLAGVAAPGLDERRTNKATTEIAGSTTTAAAHGSHGEQHQLSSLPQKDTTIENHNTGVTGTPGNTGRQQSTTTSSPIEISHTNATQPSSSQIGYGSYVDGSNNRYGVGMNTYSSTYQV